MQIPNINEIVLMNYCGEWGDSSKAIDLLLRENDSIDILYGDGLALERCIKKNDLDSISLLLSYYIRVKGRPDERLMAILQPLMDTWGSHIMRETISRHLAKSSGDGLSSPSSATESDRFATHYPSPNIFSSDLLDDRCGRIYVDRMFASITSTLVATESELRAMIETEEQPGVFFYYYWGRNILMFAVRIRSPSVPDLLDAVGRLDVAHRVSILEKVDYSGMNVLMLAAIHNCKDIFQLIEEIKKLPRDSVTKILQQHDRYSRTIRDYANQSVLDAIAGI